MTTIVQVADEQLEWLEGRHEYGITDTAPGMIRRRRRRSRPDLNLHTPCYSHCQTLNPQSQC